MKKENIHPFDSANTKTYFANLFSYAVKPYNTYFEVRQNFPLMAQIIDKLTVAEIDFLTDRIESLFTANGKPLKNN